VNAQIAALAVELYSKKIFLIARGTVAFLAAACEAAALKIRATIATKKTDNVRMCLRVFILISPVRLSVLGTA
jgi:hypothetical protein